MISRRNPAQESGQNAGPEETQPSAHRPSRPGWKRRRSFWLLPLIVAAGLLLIQQVPVTSAATRTVGSGGYSTIQAAVNAAGKGDTIRVKAGTYREQVTISKSLTIEPYDSGAVTVDGGCSRAYGFDVRAGSVTLKGVSVVNTTDSNVTVGDVTNVSLAGVTLKNWNCANGSDSQYVAGVSCWYCSQLKVTDSRIETARDYGNGIWIKSTSSNPSSGGHRILRNTIIGGFDGIGTEAEDDVWGGLVKDSYVEYNTIRNCHDDGIQIEGRNQNVRIRYNQITGCDIGIAIAPTFVGPLYIENNSISSLQPGYYGVQACFKVGDGGSGTTYLTANTCETTGDGIKQTNSGLAAIVARNNCFEVSRYVIETSTAAASGTSFNNDNLWTSDSSRFVKWGGSLHGSLSAFQSGTGQEANGTSSQSCTPGTMDGGGGTAPTATRTATTQLGTATPTPTATRTPAASATPTRTSTPTSSAGSGAVIVGSGGYSTIQAAVNAAASGSTIRIKAGTYNEQVTVNKSLTITSYGDGAVTVSGGCSRATGFDIQANNVKLQGFTVQNTTETSVNVGDVTGTAVQSMTLKDWNCANGGDSQYLAGVSCWYCSSLSVLDSHIETSRTDGNGIWLKSTSSNPSAGGHTIARNTIIGGFDGIGSEAEDDTNGGFFKDTIIEDNDVRNCNDDGIQVEGRNQNVRVRNNTISGCGIGIAFAPTLVGPLYVEYNTITGMQPKYYGVQACFKAGDGGSGTVYLTGNTCVTTGDGLKQTNSGLSPIVSRDNCFNVTRYVIELSNTPPSGSSFNNDSLWTSDGSRFIKWGGSTYGSLSSFRSATGQEMNGTQTRAC